MLAFRVNHDLEPTPEYSRLHDALASNSANIISLLQMTLHASKLDAKTSHTFLLTLASFFFYISILLLCVSKLGNLANMLKIE